MDECENGPRLMELKENYGVPESSLGCDIHANCNLSFSHSLLQIITAVSLFCRRKFEPFNFSKIVDGLRGFKCWML